MALASFIARRYLFARRKQTFISVISVISVLGVALGVASLIVAIGIMNGFTVELRDKILGINAHVMVMGGGRITDNPGARDAIASVPGVAGVTPFIYSEVMISGNGGAKGLILRGIDPKTAPDVLSILSSIKEGGLSGLTSAENGRFPGIIVGRELAKRMGLHVGSRVNLLSPSGRRGAAGFAPKINVFTVAGIFSSGMFEYDSSLGFITLDASRALLGLPQDAITGYEASVLDVYAADAVGEKIAAALGEPYYARNWMEMNANLFAALKLEKTAMFVVLTLIVVVGSFSILTTLVMLVMEKTRDIAILMAMGATKGMIRRIFMLQGLIIGVIGTALGFAVGLGLAFALKHYQFIKLPEGVYPMSTVPVLLDGADLSIIGCAAIVLCLAATLYPARQAASLQPAEALRYE